MIEMQKTIEQTLAERKADLAREMAVKKYYRNHDRIAALQKAIQILKSWIK